MCLVAARGRPLDYRQQVGAARAARRMDGVASLDELAGGLADRAHTGARAEASRLKLAPRAAQVPTSGHDLVFIGDR